MRKEDTYQQQLQELGVWQPCFSEEVHQLCIMERELSRTMKAWKATAEEGEAPSVLDPLYSVICKQRTDILSHRDSLGLTPKGLRRLKGAGVSESDTGGGGSIGEKLDALAELVGGYEAYTP